MGKGRPNAAAAAAAATDRAQDRSREKREKKLLEAAATDLAPLAEIAEEAKFDDPSAPDEEPKTLVQILESLNDLGLKKTGVDTLMIYLGFVAVFYCVLVLQKSPTKSFDVQNIIRESIDGLEWSHGNTWRVS